MLYASSDPQNQSQPIDSNAYQPFKLLDSTVVSRISHELDHLSQEDSEGSHGLYSIKFSACSSMHSPIRARRRPDKSPVLYGPFSFLDIVPFLTLHSDINRISIGSSTTTLNHVVDPRILILAVSPDLSSSYVPIMNSIFSAQKLVRLQMTTITRSLKLPQKVTIDACQVFGPDTVFLQQAAHLTGGAYLYLERRDALLQYLIVSLSISNSTFNPRLSFFKMTFLPPSSIRNVLAIPTQDKIDFRAACFCHKTIIDIGFVCSVCLSSTLAVTSSRILSITHFTSSILSTGPCVLHLPVCTLISALRHVFLNMLICRTKFPIKTLQRLNASRPMMPAPANSARPSPVSTPVERALGASRENTAMGTQPTTTTNGSQH